MKILVNNVSVYYDSIKALDNVTIEFKEGCITTILGPNGAGKTTLLKCINRILKPSDGVIYIDGKEISKLKIMDLAKIFGYVPQETNATLTFTVFEIVAMGRRPYINWRLSDADYEKVFEALKMVRAEHLMSRFFDELSGGEKQKVIIARALAQNPKVLLLDEPTSNLDLKHQIEVMELIRGLTKTRKLTVIMAMHDINLAYRYSDLIVLMKNGRIYSYGNPKHVINKENIKEIYNVDVEIIDYPYPHIIPKGVIKY